MTILIYNKHILSFWQNLCNKFSIYSYGVTWKMIIKNLVNKLNLNKNMNIYYMFITSVLILFWLNSGYFGSMSKIFLTESMLSFMMMMMMILMFVMYFMYFSYYSKMFELYIYSYVIILSLFFTTNSIILFYVTFELSIVPMFIIILGWGNQPERMMATNYLIIYTMLFSIPFMVMLLFIVNNMQYWLLSNLKFNMNSMFLFIMIMPFLIKMPMYLLHLWLPKAHVEAPIMGSMLLASILLKTGSFGLMKINDMTSKVINNHTMTLSLILSAVASIVCIIQTDMKKFVAYSSITHMTMIISLMSTNSIYMMNGTVILMLSHAIISNIMFFMSGYISNNSKSRMLMFQQNYINMTPFVWFLMMIVLFFNSSLPPSISMISEFIIFINSMLIWNGNFIISLMLFMMLTYYSIWFLTMFNLKKNNNKLITWTNISDLSMIVIHVMCYVLFWVNINILM